MILTTLISLFCVVIGFILLLWAKGWNIYESKLFLAFSLPLSLLGGLSVYYLIYNSLTSYQEIWNYPIQTVNYYEPWTEEEETCTTDKDGHKDCNTHYIRHDAKWTATDYYGDDHNISHEEYDYWKSRWHNQTEDDLFHFDQTLSSRFKGEGDRWYSDWPGQFETLFPWSQIKNYRNKLRATHTVFDFTSVDENTRKHWPRPVDQKNTNPIISSNVGYSGDDLFYLKQLNALWGPKYEIHTILYLLDGNQYPDRSIVETILSAWKGPNKNELVTFVAVQEDKIKWAEVASWMDDTTIHSLMRQDIQALTKFRVSGIIDIYRKYIPAKWKRKEFADFSYVNVPMSALSYLWIFLSATVCTVGGGYLTKYREQVGAASMVALSAAASVATRGRSRRR